MNGFVSFGEIMLRLMPRDHLRFLQEPSFEATFGGAEANVAVALANWGLNAAFATVVPDNDIGDACVRELRRFGVDVGHVVRRPGRLGVYFAECGSNQRPSKVIYDRRNSALALAQPEDLDFEAILHGRDWFHVTGITPALSRSCADLTLAAVKAAHAKGIKVSCDLNYRSSLWDYGCTPDSVMSEIVTYVDVLIGNEEDLQTTLGLSAPEIDVTSGSLDAGAYRALAQAVLDRYPNVDLVATTLRESLSASTNGWSACLADRHDFLVSSSYLITDIVDRVGGGDAFAAGLIYGLNQLDGRRAALEFGTASGALNHSLRGDFNQVSVDEIARLAAGEASGRVRR